MADTQSGGEETVRFAVRLLASRVYLVQDTLTGRIREATYDLRDAVEVAARLEESGGFAGARLAHARAKLGADGLAHVDR
jgi:hypothetical protein